MRAEYLGYFIGIGRNGGVARVWISHRRGNVVLHGEGRSAHPVSAGQSPVTEAAEIFRLSNIRWIARAHMGSAREEIILRELDECVKPRRSAGRRG